MRRLKRSDILSASDLGFCLVCGPDESCRCPVFLCESNPQKRRIYSFYTGDSGRFFLCPACKSVSQFSADLDLYRCTCGYVFEHNFLPSVLSERDYSEELNVSDLPKRALRKPKI